MLKELAQLEALLRQEIDAQKRLTAAVGRKLAAMRQADHRGVVACCQEENRLVQSGSDLAKARMTLVAQLTQALDPAAAQPLRLGELAEKLSEPARGKLLLLRSQLRQEMETVRRQSGIARGAAQVLAAHMLGLVQMVGSAMSGVGVYDRGGALPRTAVAIRTFQTMA
jgi:hypothetical protein